MLGRLRRMGRDQAGFTMTEMIVTVMLLGIVLTFTIQGLISMTQATNRNDLRLQNLDEARVIMGAVSKDLRTGTMLVAGTSPFIVAEDNRVVFYANLSATGPKKVEIYIDATNPKEKILVEKVTDQDPGSDPPTYTTQPAKTRLVGKYVANGTGMPLFTYYDSTGAVLTPTPLDATNMLAVRSVGITLAIRKDVDPTIPSTTLVNRVSLPNIFYNIVASPTPT